MIQKIRNQYFNIFIFSQFLIFFFLVSAFIIKNRNIVFSLYIFIFIFCCVSYYCLYVICKQITKHAELEAKNILSKRQQEYQNKHLLVSKENVEIINKVREEIYKKIDSYKNITIQNEEEARNFAKELISEYSFLYEIDYCNNKIIDAILYHKIILAKKQDIKTSVQVIVPKSIAIKAIDIMSVYTNLLDNAIEACAKLPSKDRFIDIYSMVSSNYLIIKICNSKSPDLHVNLQNIKTSKVEDIEHHGLGLQIVIKTCNENNGSFKLIDTKDSIEAIATLQLNTISN